MTERLTKWGQISEPGWYRIIAWEPVTAAQAEAEIRDGRGQDLIMIQSPESHAYQSSEAT